MSFRLKTGFPLLAVLLKRGMLSVSYMIVCVCKTANQTPVVAGCSSGNFQSRFGFSFGNSHCKDCSLEFELQVVEGKWNLI